MAATSRHMVLAGLAAGLLATTTCATATALATARGGPEHHSIASAASSSRLPVKEIEDIEQADGTYSSGVLTIDIDRDGAYRLHGVALSKGFEVQHELYFQSLGNGDALFNGELAVPQIRVQATISAIEDQGLVFQALHQHFLDIHPMVWFIHFRGSGNTRQLAERVHAVVEATRVDLPQSSPKHPTTRLPVKQLTQILGGDAQVEAHGVVDIEIDRRNHETLGGQQARPDLGIAPNVEFMPLRRGRALVVPDFGMTTPEIQKVTALMRSLGWTDECLYNQENGEHPQLFWSHMVKAGSATTLARQVRRALDLMNVEPAKG
ncbi:MAG TPA: DUF1259 domain-containing protein [Mycobacteriales bacterium]|nr:DUF1259 domain-containing protein [Mycobacteriales bacterium]